VIRLGVVAAIVMFVVVGGVGGGVPVTAQRGVRVVTDAECAAPLGAGVKTKRAFCDVLIATAAGDSVSIAIPPHSGSPTLRFDLHNRFTVPAIVVPGALTFARHEAIVSVVRPTGSVISKAAVVREFRAVADLFDQIGGGANPGGVKAVAPGPGEPIRVTVPTGLTSVGIVGTRLAVLMRSSQEVFDTPGRPVAIVSNVRLEYRPR
jgi:hypothetical protein